MTVRYLLRFDDICPSMNWHAWDAVEQILLTYEVNPILAVIPDNRDEMLRVCAPDPRFWDRVRVWQVRGWTIAMHGWQHCFVTKDGGILQLNDYSEFAGLPRHEQEMKIRSGLEIFEREGIHSDTWIAPAHSFDELTIQVLCESGFRYMSDGFCALPHVDRFGMTWIPQQLWSFRWRPYGVWTICFHLNRWTASDVLDFKESVKKYRDKVSDLNGILSKYQGRHQDLVDTTAAQLYRSAVSIKSTMKRMASHFDSGFSVKKKTGTTFTLPLADTDNKTITDQR